MAQSWGAASRLLSKDVRKEERELEKAARKSGLAGSFGSFLGGLGAMALTGGVVNPITTGLITAGASGVGGLAGKQLLTGRKTKETLAGKRGKFLMSDRKELRESLTGDILKGALTAGATAGISQFSTNIKEGLTGMGKAKVPDAPSLDIDPTVATKATSNYENINKSLSEARGKKLIEEAYAKEIPIFETPDVGNIAGSGSGSVLKSDEYREKFFKRFGYYPK